MEELVVSRWTKYGKDRLYVSTTGGEEVGWLDLVTGRRTLDRPEHQGAFDRALAEHAALAGGPTAPGRHARGGAEHAPTELVTPAPAVLGRPEERPVQPAGPAPQPGEDLATRKAGEMARQQAVAARQAAPGRTFVARLVGVHTDERAWRIGADGEELVGAQLGKLIRKDPRWKALHAIEVGDKGSDIDHLVIGPGGVFTLNTKHHPKAKIWVGGNTFMVNGNRQPYVRNSRHEAERASRLLSAACGFPVLVCGVVVPVNADSLTIKAQPDDVRVVSRKRLIKWLQGFRRALGEQDIAAIFAAARQERTWRP
jgi:hypothetical protein